jgi:hypothetical protein
MLLLFSGHLRKAALEYADSLQWAFKKNCIGIDAVSLQCSFKKKLHWNR